MQTSLMRLKIVCLLLNIFFIVAVHQSGWAQTAKLVKDIEPGKSYSIPNFLTNVNGTLFFRAHDPTFGTELWKSDGSLNGTILIKDICPGNIGINPCNSDPRDLTNINGIVFFAADDGINGYELWKSDGTTSGTVLVKDIYPGPTKSNPLYLTEFNGILYFQATDDIHGAELWKSDGTASGTVLAADIVPGLSSSAPRFLINVNGTLFFAAFDTVHGYELWKSDGTANGTMLVKDINPGPSSSSPFRFFNVNGTLFFVADDGSTGRELWKSDGTPSGTVLVKDILPGPGWSDPNEFAQLNNNLYFQALAPNLGWELWTSDGTTNGTFLVKDINPGTANSLPKDLINFNGSLFFSAFEPVHGGELWVSDGTTSGTVLFKDIVPGEVGAAPRDLTVANGNFFFAARTPELGEELWQSDGTPSGTIFVRDIEPGPGTRSSFPIRLTAVNGTLFFGATEGQTGNELWATLTPITVTLSPSNPPIQIPPDGGPFQFTTKLYNGSGRSESAQYWNQIILPDGSTLGPTFDPVSVTIASDDSIVNVIVENVPGQAPPGQYTYIINVGTFPERIWDSDSFIFTKLSTTTSLQSSDSQSPDSLTNNSEQERLVDENPIPKQFAIMQNYPNPFNPSTTISYQLPKAEQVKIIIYDLTGRVVRELTNKTQGAGSYSVQWDGRDQAGQKVASGVYIYKIQAGQFTRTRKMVLLK